MIKISRWDSCKVLLVFTSLLVASCSKSNDNGSSFRIVGLNGESRQIQTRVPELNARIIESQSHQAGAQSAMPNQMPPQMTPQSSVQQPQMAEAQNSQGVAENVLKDAMQADQGKPTYNLANNEPVAAKKTEDNQGDAMVSVGAVGEKDQEIQYDLSEGENAAKKSGKKMKLKSEKAVVVKEGQAPEVAVVKAQKKGIFVQTGSFSTAENAKHEFAKMQKFHKGTIEEAEYGEKKIYRVLLGPLQNDKKAKALVQKIKASGHDAIVVKHK